MGITKAIYNELFKMRNADTKRIEVIELAEFQPMIDTGEVAGSRGIANGEPDQLWKDCIRFLYIVVHEMSGGLYTDISQNLEGFCGEIRAGSK